MIRGAGVRHKTYFAPFESCRGLSQRIVSKSCCNLLPRWGWMELMCEIFPARVAAEIGDVVAVLAPRAVADAVGERWL